MGRRKSTAEGPDALLLVDKPAGISSAAVVARVRRVFGGVKAGHTGTLDPFATGLLPVCLGEGTKAATYLTEADKTYEGVIRLGVVTDTLDGTGVVTATAEVPELEAGRLEEVASEFRGDILQLPPTYSAIKRGGRPMYELARRGEAPELEPRPVRVDRLELRLLDPERLAVSVDCSKGFYVRSLAHDIGARLGCGAMLESLRRTRVGRLRIEDAVPLEEIEGDGGLLRASARLLGLGEALADLPRVEIPPRDAADLRLGRQAPLASLAPGRSGQKVRLTAGRDLVAVAVSEGRVWVLERVFASSRPNASCPAGGFVLPAAVSQLEEEERNEANRRD